MCGEMSEKDHSQSLVRIKLKKYLSDSFALIKTDFMKIKYVLLAAGIYILIVKRFLHKMCPFVLLTGYPCPLCGMTRAFFALFRGDFKTAWELHPFACILVVVILILAIRRYIFHKEIRNIRKMMILISAGIVFLYVYRMMFCFNGVPPMSYYSDNLIHRIMTGLMP